MAIQLLKENDKFNTYHQHFLIDGSDDLTSLEANYKCQMGDYAELPDGTIYVRHSDDYSGDKWVVKSSSGNEGSGLPDVTAEDNGDVLTVVDGAWAKAALPTVLEVHLSDGTLDKTWQEIHQATIATINYDSDLGQVREFVIRCWYDDVDQLYKISSVTPTVDFQSVQHSFEASTVNDYPEQEHSFEAS